MSQTPRKGSLLVIFLTVFIDLLGFGMVLPILPIYAEHLGKSSGMSSQKIGMVTGLLMASFSLMQFLFLPFWGRMSDRFGRRPIILIGLAGSTFFYAMFGVASAAGSLIGLFGSRIGAGIAGATISTAQAYIADSTTKETRNKGMALIGAAFALGFTLGPLLGGFALFMGGRADLSPWPGYVASLLSGTALLLGISRLSESWQPGADQAGRPLIDLTAFRQAVSTPTVGTLLLGTFVSVFSFANFETTLALQVKRFVDQQSASSSGSPFLEGIISRIKHLGFANADDVKLTVVLLAFGYLGIVLTLVQGVLVRRLAGRLSEGTMIAIGAVAALTGFSLLAYAAMVGNLSLFLGSMAIEVMGFAFVNPSLQSLISRRISPEFQGGILGLSQSFSSMARILGPIFGVNLFAYSPPLPYWLAAAVFAIAMVFMFPAIRSGRDFRS